MNGQIKFTVDKSDWIPKDPDGKILAPIIYDGSSYLPVRALATATGLGIDWDAATNTIKIDTKRSDSSTALPYKDAASYKPPGGDAVSPTSNQTQTTAQEKTDSTNNSPSSNPVSDVPNSIVNYWVKEENKLVYYDYLNKLFWLRSENPGKGVVENQKLVFNVDKQEFNTMIIRYLPSESGGWHTYTVKDQNGNTYPIENTSQSYTYQTNQNSVSASRTMNAWQGTVHFNKGPVTKVYVYYSPLDEKHFSENLLVDSFFSK